MPETRYFQAVAAGKFPQSCPSGCSTFFSQSGACISCSFGDTHLVDEIAQFELLVVGGRGGGRPDSFPQAVVVAARVLRRRALQVRVVAKQKVLHRLTVHQG